MLICLTCRPNGLITSITEQIPNMDMTELARKVNEQNNTIIELQKNIDKLVQEKERCKTIADIQVEFIFTCLNLSNLHLNITK